MPDHQDRPLPNVTCPGCGATGHVSLVTRNEEVTIRGMTLRADIVWRKCSACQAEFENTQDPDWRIQAYAD